MNIEFKDIKIRNFMSFESVDYYFNDKGTILIEGQNETAIDNAGSNGAGKSSLFEAIAWSITGETIRGTKQVARYNCEDKCSVTIHFDLDNNDFIITREKNPTSLLLEVNGKDKTGKGIKDTEKLIHDYLPDLTSEFIGSVIILGQGLPTKFTNNSPSGRKELLETLSKTNYMYEDIKKRADRETSNINDDIKKCESKCNKLKTSQAVTESKLAQLNDELKRTDIEALKTEQENISAQLIPLKQKHDELVKGRDKADLKASVCSCKLAEVRESMHDTESALLSNEKASLQEYKSRRATISTQLCTLIKRNVQIEDLSKDKICPTCGQTIKAQIIPQEYYENNNTITELNKEAEEVKKSIAELEAKIGYINKEILGNYKKSEDALLKEQTEIKNEFAVLKSEVSKIENTIYNLQVNHDALTQNIDIAEQNRTRILNDIEINNNKLNSIKENLLYSESELLRVNNKSKTMNKINSLITKKFRGFLLEDIITYINNTAKKLSKEVFNKDYIDIILENNNINIYFDNKNYENLSGGEKCKIDIIIQLALREMLCKYTNFKCNIFCLDEGLDYLDNIGCEKILNLIYNNLNDVDTIYIISHHTDDLPIPYDSKIVIRKDKNKISHIEI